ncbi:histidine kinase [Rhodanobacter thiooxydans]|uniref:Histidine kinase n=1 Tax=Rhodanobacter thiooxydans TaxID=416169 RepID=A0A154QET6_9GAMM|nr:response regulator [Rhodanobacter thiooxydans]EIL99280.1 response regulator [Rhodanobacter thiooxydans LCS2]KZC22777.1 histidine kinase [Rhodanobacter thiooxydans]MCW0202100.1 response regulator [Rhodanobacter thiooxydans]
MSANRVLLVENDAATREVTRLLLNHAGYDVVAVHDLATGLAISRERQDIGMLVADMYLGCGEQSTSLISHLRRDNAAFPIVPTSADNEASLIAGQLKVVFLRKPYGRLELLSAIDCAASRAHLA